MQILSEKLTKLDQIVARRPRALLYLYINENLKQSSFAKLHSVASNTLKFSDLSSKLD